jgi:hypothetical protein
MATPNGYAVMPDASSLMGAKEARSASGDRPRGRRAHRVGLAGRFTHLWGTAGSPPAAIAHVV